MSNDWMTYYKFKYPLATEEEIAIQVFGPLDYSFEIRYKNLNDILMIEFSDGYYIIDLNSNINCNISLRIRENSNLFNINLSNVNSNLGYVINSNSNYFENKINSINTDTIPIGLSNKFIINNIYITCIYYW